MNFWNFSFHKLKHSLATHTIPQRNEMFAASDWFRVSKN